MNVSILNFAMATFDDKLKSFVTQRKVIRCRITKLFNNTLQPQSSNLSVTKELVNNYLAEISVIDKQIVNMYIEKCDGDDLDDLTVNEIESQAEYVSRIKTQLADLDKSSPQASNVRVATDNHDSHFLRLPPLKCETFSGEGKNVSFYTFFSKFHSVVNSRTDISKSVKLTYLTSFLTGYAYKLIQHLQINDDNYDVALKLLEREFLDTDTLKNDHIAKLLNLKPKYDPSYVETKIFINEVRCLVSDLSNFDLDFDTEESGNTLLSHIVFNKLPLPFRQELVRKLAKNFPKLSDIFDNYVEIINLLKIKIDKPKDSYIPSHSFQKPVKAEYSNVNASQHNVESTSSSKKSTSVNYVKNCKFCATGGHSMYNCMKYPTFQNRSDRCDELKLCKYCTSQNHLHADCPRNLNYKCNVCGKKDHISALCPTRTCEVSTNYINSSAHSGHTYLLPVITIEVGHGTAKTKIRCLLDTGSQRSYISDKVLEKLGSVNQLQTQKITINTFIDSADKTFSELCLFVNFFEGGKYPLPFLVHDSFNLNFSIDGLTSACKNIGSKFNLIESFDSDEILLEGLLGVDCIQYLQQCNLITCLGGKAFELHNGVIPFGNIDGFLYSNQLARKYSKATYNKPNLNYNEPNQISDDSYEVNSIVNFILNPIKTNFDPLGGVMSDSQVEHNLDKMFNIESLGITEESSSYDEFHINKFNENVSFTEGKYHVKLPWNDNINDVKSNYGICKSVVNKVVSKLKNDDLYDDYNKVFEQQLADGIIEPVDLSTINPNDHVWIPHRPVIKQSDQVTTKLRIVLNCSLKINDAPSLNEAAYEGINLVNHLLELLIKIRSDKYFVMSDIKQAFLMIKLSTAEDKNKFSILWIDKTGKLIAYRYSSIVFGFISSPFILQNVIKLHLQNYPNDACNKILNHNLYVDNLFFTGDNQSTLLDLYNETFQRMMSGGFELRSWVSNCKPLMDKIIEDRRGPSHSSDHEKVLGYIYEPDTDKLKLSQFNLNDNNILTKRIVLSNLAKVFDPLGLTLPVTVKGKTFVSKLWKEGYDWDQPLDELNSEWLKIQNDLSSLPNLSFPRKAYNGDTSLFIFCDSSKSTYGFSCYAKCDNSCNLVFAKAKTAPSKSKSLPTLELLSAFLAIKCLDTIIKSLNANIIDINICVDAQIVLSWILTGRVKSKNIFANNRVKEISNLRNDIKLKYNLDVKFKYIPTEDNPADLLTRGISFKDFKSKFEFWLHGPKFLSTSPFQWPIRTLGCLSEKDKLLTCNAVINHKLPLLPVERFSNVNKLYRVTAYVFKFIKLCRKVKTSIQNEIVNATQYWLKYEQSVHFQNEINFLNDHSVGQIPTNVKNLNLYIDEQSLIRCKGRINKSDFSHDIKCPVLLPRFSTLTELIIHDAHDRCKHLGTASTLNFLRKNGYWIPKGRARVKSILSKCILCKKLNSLAYKYPQPTDFIRDKTKFQTPYQHTGIDFTGHVFVKQGNCVVKMYILIFTCLNIRSIHLELLPSLTCKDFLLAFIRFCNSCNIPSVVYSDNANTFLKSMNILSHSVIDNDFDSYLVKNNIKHNKIPLYSAWVGAAWERMIRTIKQCLYKTIGRKHYNYFQFFTLLTDVENCINSRPLTYLNEDSLDVITPNAFLKFNTGRSLLMGDLEEDDFPSTGRKELVDSLLKRESMLDKFKSMWYEEYLLSLREKSKDVYQNDWTDRISVGEVVLIRSPIKPRAQWQMARVTELLTGTDGKTRSAKVMRPDHSEGVYSICHLYPLELSIEPSLSKSSDDQQTVEIKRPRRLAASKCLQLLKGNN